jgi:hypothetical protein
MLKDLWRGWLAVARKIGRFQSQVVLTLFYFVVVAPFALAVRLFADPLSPRGAAAWHPLTRDDRSALSIAKQQF